MNNNANEAIIPTVKIANRVINIPFSNFESSLNCFSSSFSILYSTHPCKQTA